MGLTKKQRALLNASVAKTSGRYAIDEVFADDDGRLNATNGIAGVRTVGPVLSKERPERPHNRTTPTPPMKDLFIGLRAPRARCQVELPPTEPPASQVCRDCKGSKGKCPECNGRGGEECFECGNARKCTYCDSTGEITRQDCKACEGTGLEDVISLVAVGEWWFRYSTIKPLADFGVPEVSVEMKGDSVWLCWEHDGMEGRVMPFRDPSRGIVWNGFEWVPGPVKFTN